MSDFNLLIDGKMVPGDLTMPVLNPATEEVLAQCPRASKAPARRGGRRGQGRVSGVGRDPDRRAPQARRPRWPTSIEANANELARLLTQEQGKPLADATGEVMGMAGLLPLSHLARPADAGDRGLRRPPGRGASPPARRGRRHRPLEFPLLILSFKLPSALLAGNTLVVKPAPTTPLSTLKFAELIKDILPKGVLNVITDANDLGDAMTAHPDIRKISFTGSTATGQKVMASAAETLKRITLEFGGNDASHRARRRRSEEGRAGDLRRRVPELRPGLPRHQAALCARVHLRRNVRRTGRDRQEHGGRRRLEQGTKLGPLQNKMQYEKVKGIIEDARKNGKIIAGGAAMDRPGYFIEPTIVRDINEGSRLVDEEQFGPVLPVIKYSDNDDVIRRANATNYGLGASIWSSDTARAHKVASRIEAGTVWINKHLDMAPHIPFGGAKHSGIGTEFAEEGLAEFTQLQMINEARSLIHTQ